MSLHLTDYQKKHPAYVIWRKRYIALCTMFVIFNVSGAVPEKISLGTTRIIYQEKDTRGVSLSFNNATSRDFLLESHVVNISPSGFPGSPSAALLVVPPLTVAHKHTLTPLHVFLVSAHLPDDRESAFYLSENAIPAEKVSGMTQLSRTPGITLNTSTELDIKLFYRPPGLGRDRIRNVSSQVVFSWLQGELIATNPTPYYLTFSKLSAGGERIPPEQLRQMLAPCSTARYRPAKAPEYPRDVSWQVIDEDGHSTPEEHRVLSVASVTGKKEISGLCHANSIR